MSNSKVWLAVAAAVMVMVALAATGDWLVGMNGVSAYGTALDLWTALLAIGLALGGLRILDNQLGYDTVERINAMADMPFAIYLGARLVAVCLLLGLALS